MYKLILSFIKVSICIFESVAYNIGNYFKNIRNTVRQCATVTVVTQFLNRKQENQGNPVMFYNKKI